MTSTRLDCAIFSSPAVGCRNVTIKYDGEELRPDEFSVNAESGVVTLFPETTGPDLLASFERAQQGGKTRKKAQWKRELMGRM